MRGSGMRGSDMRGSDRRWEWQGQMRMGVAEVGSGS